MNSLIPEYILFDLDGTILDSLPGIESSLKAAFQAIGLPLFRSDFRALIGPPIRTILSIAGNLTDDCMLNALESAFREHYDTVGWQKTRCFPDVRGVLRQLREMGYSLFVVSNKPRQISRRILEREGLWGYFESVINRDSRAPAYSGKAEMIEALLQQQNIIPAKSLLIGDTIEDASASAQTGIAFFLAAYGYGGDREMSSISPMHRIDRLPQLLELIRRPT